MTREELKKMDEFNDKMREIIAVFPIEFYNLVYRLAWERCHAEGYEEVLQEAECITFDLKSALDNFKRNYKCPHDLAKEFSSKTDGN